MRRLKRSSKLVAIILAMLCTASSVALTSSAIENGSSASNDVELSEYGLPKDSLYNTNKAMPDTWVFTDGLGRVSLTNAEVGDVRDDKTVVMFYWDWHEDLGNGNAATNTNELMKLYPDAKNNYNHSAWSGTGKYCFWNEPIYGFYRTSDTWVLRRQSELLANLGVDAIVNDNTNGSFTWRNGYLPLYEEWLNAQTDGVDVPKISFMFPFVDTQSTYNQLLGAGDQSIYGDIYSTDKYQSLWFYWDDKPLLIGPNAAISDDIKEQFTWRTGQADYYFTSEPMLLGSWGWLSTYPQVSYSAEKRDYYMKQYEQITVGVACNHDYRTHHLSAMNAGKYIMGRSYTSTYEDRYENEGSDASLYGYFFSEQFDYALKQDPEVVFITGWNEWHAWRQATPWGADGVTNALVDQFDNEYSRDLEPTKGELKDHYYYLAANYIRKYKGCNPIPTPSLAQTIDMTAGYKQWENVAPYYASYIGNTDDRDSDGYGSNRKNQTHYTETSGRNDIIGAQVARDDEYVYFHVECADNITSYTDSLWMNLYIDSDQENQGWETFDYVINKSPASEKTLVLEKFIDGYASEKVADVEYSVDGRYMTVKVPKSAIGVSGYDYTINFAWTDNVHDEGDYSKYSGDIMDFYISGDVAPGGRFKYSYVSTYDNAGKEAPVVDEETTENNTSTEVITEELTTEGAANTTTAEQVTNNNDKGGCGSAIGMSVIMIPTISAAVVSIAAKRKKKRK